MPPTRSSFGTSVVRELIPYELGGTGRQVRAASSHCCPMSGESGSRKTVYNVFSRHAAQLAALRALATSRR